MLNCLFSSKRHGDFGTLAQGGFQLQLGIVDLGNVLDDGKAQARAAGLSGAAFIHPIEALEDPLLGLFGDADAVVLHHKDGASLLLYRHLDIAPLPIVADGILHQVLYHFLQ